MGARNKEKAWEIDERREMGEGGEEDGRGDRDKKEGDRMWG